MTIQTVLPFISTAIMAFFTLSVLERYLVRRKLHFLFWGIGLAMFGAGSFAEAYFASRGWNSTVFFVWYLFGAALNAGWIGHGTMLLLARRRWVHIFTVVLVLGSLAAAIGMLQIMPRLDAASFNASLPISEQYRTIMPKISDGAWVRMTTPFFNIYGLVTLVGGALWSAWLFLRKQVLPNRVVGNILIAVGAIAIGAASTATRLGSGQYLYLGELVAAILMFTGFRTASAPATEAEMLAAEAQAA